MSDLILRQADIDRFTETLKKLISKSHVSVAALIHRDGHLLASAGKTDAVDATALSALVSANFSSTVAIANLVGEKEFTTQHHAGKKQSILVSLVDEFAFIVAVLAVDVPIEPVKTCAEEYRAELTSALERLYKNEPDGMFPTGDDLDDFSLGAYADAEDVARAAKGKPDGGQAVPRKLSYTGTGKSTTAKTQKKPAAAPEEQQHGAREQEAEDADFDALARAISSRAEREGQKTTGSATKKGDGAKPKESDKGDVIVIDGQPMNVVSLKSKGKKGRGRRTT
jgi:predicted regulator of Ras-like GTPase activity (Roadblock/LC7/MglB family)